MYIPLIPQFCQTPGQPRPEVLLPHQNGAVPPGERQALSAVHSWNIRGRLRRWMSHRSACFLDI